MALVPVGLASVLRRGAAKPLTGWQTALPADFVGGSHTSENKIAFFVQVERFFAVTSYKFSRFKNFDNNIHERDVAFFNNNNIF